MSYLLSNLLSLDPISDGIQHRWSQNAHIIQQDVDMRWNLASKMLSKRCDDRRPIKEDDDADMRATCVESLVTSILGRQVEDSMENKCVGNEN